MNKTTAIVLAAGKGKRMKSLWPKVLSEVCGQPLIYYVLKQLSKIKSIKEIVVVLGYKDDLVKSKIKEISANQLPRLSGRIKFVKQAQMLGTADAVKAALTKARYGEILVTCGDNPLIRSKTLSSFLSFSRRKRLDCCIFTTFMDKQNQLGTIIYNNKGKVKAIEEKIAGKGKKETAGSDRVNSGTYYFVKKELSADIKKIKKNKRKKEYFLTDIVEIFYNQGKKIDSYLGKDSSEAAGINNLFELQFAEENIRKRIIAELTRRGITVVSPMTTIIQESVKIGKNTTIYPFTFIEKGAIIGSNCSVGPFLHIRGDSRINNHTQVGNFLEINRSHLGKNVRAKHFGYLGDSYVSDGVNIGAGTVVANYNGKSKNKTYIEKGSFIGCDTVLVAPVTVGKKAKTGAGSVVTKNVKKGQVVAGVPARQLKGKE